MILLFLVVFGVVLYYLFLRGNFSGIVTFDKRGIDRIVGNHQKIDCQQKVGLNKDICKFLNFQSPYSDEEVRNSFFIKQGVNITKLGLESSSRIEGLLLGYIDDGNSVLMLVGFDGRSNDRFVVPIKIPIHVIENENNNISFFVYKLNTSDLNDTRTKTKFNIKSDILNVLSSLKDKTIVLMFFDELVGNEEINKLKHNQIVTDYIMDVNKQVVVTRALLGSVNSNGLILNYADSNHDPINISSIEEVNKDFGEFPIVTNIIARLN